jgi:pimeloyl-ACP methyl ester carboxylesterase
VVLAGHSMGGALALLAAAERPEAVERLVLISPAGLPLTKPMLRSGLQFFSQVAQRRFPFRHAATSIAGVATAPHAALRVALEVRRLDLSPQMRTLAAAGVPVTVVGCSTDTLVTSDSCRRAADLLGARYDELEVEGGHMWMFGRWPTFEAVLAG